MKDIHFWVNICMSWMQAKSESEKQEVVDKVLSHEVYQANFAKIRERVETGALAGNSLDKQFFELISLSNGFGYHVGYYFWELEIQAGQDIQKLLKLQPEVLVKRWLG